MCRLPWCPKIVPILYWGLGLFLALTFPEWALGETLFSFPRVTRGAYLQCATPDSIVVRWRTAQATSGAVRYGQDPQHLAEMVSSGARLHDHAVRLSGLLPNTRYFY